GRRRSRTARSNDHRRWSTAADLASDRTSGRAAVGILGQHGPQSRFRSQPLRIVREQETLTGRFGDRAIEGAYVPFERAVAFLDRVARVVRGKPLGLRPWKRHG